MKLFRLTILLSGMWVAVNGSADELTKDAAVGGGVGGALGGAIGAELGGREGAIIGAGVGAATGAAVTTKDHEDDSHDDVKVVVPANKGTFCPPGQAKKGRC